MLYISVLNVIFAYIYVLNIKKVKYMSSNARERLLEFIAYKGISQRQFYLRAGLSAGFLTKGKSVGSENIRKIILAYPEINLEWLILGVGNMLQSHIELEAKKESNSFLPLVDISTLAKEPEIDYGTASVEPIDVFFLGKNYKDCTTAVQIWGESMRPEFFPGDIAILKRISSMDYLQWGFAHLVITDKQHFFNRIQRSNHQDKIRLFASQTDSEFFEIRTSDIVSIYETRAMVRRLMT